VTVSFEALKYLINFHPSLKDSLERDPSWAFANVQEQNAMLRHMIEKIDIFFIFQYFV
jgi:hypothetical protein